MVSRQRIILLVEDNPNDEDLTVMALNKSNIADEIIVIRDGEEVLDYFACQGQFSQRDPSVLPGVVLLDLKLPKVSGLELIRHIRAGKKTRYLPIVVLSSSNEEQDIITSYELGANSYVRKPVNFESFLDIARNLGMYWLDCNEVPFGA